MAEVETLKKELGRPWQNHAYDSACTLGNAVLFAEGNRILDMEVTASRSEHSDILLHLPDPGPKAEQTEIRAMDLALDGPNVTRRFSDPTYSSRAAPRMTVPMRRSQTESAAPINRCSPAVTQEMSEWSLTQLKDSAILRRLYLNTLQHNGIESLAGSNWKDRATDFWYKDSPNGIGGNSEFHSASASMSAHEVRSCHDQSSTQSISSSLVRQHRLEGNLQPANEMTAHLEPLETYAMLQQNSEDVSQPASPTSPLSSHDYTTDDIETKDRDQAANPVMDGVNEQSHLAEDESLADPV
jgi:hypothetical protein